MTVAPEQALSAVAADARYRAADNAPRPEPGWRERGACVGLDPELFFPHPAEDPVLAVSVCRDCVVMDVCLAAALDSGECEGVWGATTPAERREMRRLWRRRPQQ